MSSKVKGPIELSDEVKDSVTGYQGVVVSRTNFLHGCTRFGVQAPTNKEGQIKDGHSFDEPQLVLMKKAKVKITPLEDRSPGMSPGGPAPYRTAQRAHISR